MTYRVQIQIVTYQQNPKTWLALRMALGQSLSPQSVLWIQNGHVQPLADDLAGQIETICLPENRGYAAAHNVGFAIAFERGMHFVVTLNPDALLSSAYLETTITAMTRHSLRIGGATGKLTRTRPQPRLDSTGLILDKFYHAHDRGQGQRDHGQFDTKEIVWGISGAAAVYKTEMLRQLSQSGPVLNEIFFAYKEDVELCWRARDLGWNFLYVPPALAIHNRHWTRGWSPIPASVRAHSFANQIFILQMYRNRSAYGLPATVLEAVRFGLLGAAHPRAAKDAAVKVFKFGKRVRAGQRG